MTTPISLFDYNLPPELIAQEPAKPRDSSRLLVLNLEGRLEHRRFSDIIEYLKSGDVLVFNDTKVFKARLRGKILEKEIEVFLLSGYETAKGYETTKIHETTKLGFWEALLKPCRRVRIGDKIKIQNQTAMVCEKHEDGTVLLSFEMSSEKVIEFADKYGEIPIPPYIKKVPEKLETYQTVYARETGSVAAPTAGFHFTKELLQKIREKGIEIEFVTLHVGIGTFRPVKSETLEEHKMHSETVEIKPDAAQRINLAKKEGRRVIAVGTTTTRALEGVAMINSGQLPENGFFGEVNIFITPGFKFNIIDGLVTNFHLPKSTLLVLVSALAGRENILPAYKEAVKEKYRFYSFGDAMFIC